MTMLKYEFVFRAIESDFDLYGAKRFVLGLVGVVRWLPGSMVGVLGFSEVIGKT
jgi:hypothetical protein